MKPTVYVMMSTYNGEKYIREQLDSILAQAHVNITLAIRDDGSTDKTIDILREYSDRYSCISLVCGENLGYAGSFWTLLLTAPCTYDYYAFSDQDDMWEPDKTAAAIYALRQSDNPVSLYASALQVTDDKLNILYKNDFPGLTISLGSATTRPRLSGCTMVFGKGLLELCRTYDIIKGEGSCLSHDVAVYLTCLACGGRVMFSKKSYIRLRRHEQTVTGHGKSIFKRIGSVTNIFTERKYEASRQTAFLYDRLKGHMTDDSIAWCETVLGYRSSAADTIKFCIDRRNKCHVFSVDAVNIFAILARCY